MFPILSGFFCPTLSHSITGADRQTVKHIQTIRLLIGRLPGRPAPWPLIATTKPSIRLFIGETANAGGDAEPRCGFNAIRRLMDERTDGQRKANSSYVGGPGS